MKAHQQPPLHTPTTLLPCFCDSLPTPPPVTALWHQPADLPTTTGRKKHILTNDLSFLPNTVQFSTLRKILKLPFTHHPNEVGKISQAFNSFRDELDNWYHETFGNDPTLRNDYNHWFSPLNKTHRTLQKKRMNVVYVDPLPVNWRNHLKTLKKAGICIARSDKGNHMLLACPIIAHTILNTVMNNDDRYQRTTLNDSEAQLLLQQTLLKYTNKHFTVAPRAPFMQTQIKDHSQPLPKVRNVCNHANAGCRQAEDHLTRILTLVMKDLDSKHVLTSTHQAHTSIPSTTTNLEAFDIEGMFDNVRLDEAYDRIGSFITSSFASRPGARINAAHKHHTRWTNWSPKDEHHYYNCQQALGLLHTILHQDYAHASGVIYRSLRGIPMGGCPSTIIASLLCLSIELELLPLARTHYGPDMVYNRFVDDAISSLTPIQFLTLFQPHFQQAGMRFIHSPRASDGGVPFLESTFYSSAKGTHATHYSKRYHLFPNSIDLSHRGSATPQSNQIARIKAEAIRLYRVTSTVEAYANALLKLQFRNRAYPLRLFQSSFLHTLTHCLTTNKYGIPSPQLHHAYLAIGQGKLLKLPK